MHRTTETIVCVSRTFSDAALMIFWLRPSSILVLVEKSTILISNKSILRVVSSYLDTKKTRIQSTITMKTLFDCLFENKSVTVIAVFR